MAVCGDPTCNSSGCDEGALDRYLAQQERDAREVVYDLLNAEAAKRGMTERLVP